jgi:hypothetical protein
VEFSCIQRTETVSRYFGILTELLVVVVLSLNCLAAGAAEPPAQGAMNVDGSVHVPAHDIPLSNYMSAQAKKSFIDTAHDASTKTQSASTPIAEARQSVDKMMWEKVAHLQSIYPVNIEKQIIAGVRTDVVTPKDGVSPKHRDRVLINLHGGGFQVGAVWHGLAESIPVSSIGKFEVITATLPVIRCSSPQEASCSMWLGQLIDNKVEHTLKRVEF